METDSCPWWMLAYIYVFGRGRAEVPAVPAEGWGRRPEPLPPPPLRHELGQYLGCAAAIVFGVLPLALEFRGFLLDDEYSVVNVAVLLLTRLHMLVAMMKSSPAPASWTALAPLPTCPPAPVLITPPVCYDWEKPAAAAMVLPGISGSTDSNWQSNEQGGDYMAAKKCFDSLVRDAAWTCDEHDDDNKAAMKCFDSLVRDAARICFVWGYDAIAGTQQSDDDPPPT